MQPRKRLPARLLKAEETPWDRTPRGRCHLRLTHLQTTLGRNSRYEKPTSMHLQVSAFSKARQNRVADGGSGLHRAAAVEKTADSPPRRWYRHRGRPIYVENGA